NTFLSTEGMACLELTAPGGNAAAPLRDSRVLVIVGDDALRAEALAALKKMGIDAVGARDTAEAKGAVATLRPSVLVTAWDVDREEVAAFRTQVLGGEERCRLVEITRELPSFHLSGFDRFET